MNKKELQFILQEGEGLRIEFKPSLSDINRIVEVVCSFANSKGGTILAGVSDNGNICGKVKHLQKRTFILHSGRVRNT